MPICGFFLDRLDCKSLDPQGGNPFAMQGVLFAFVLTDATTYNLFCIGRHDLNLRLPSVNRTT